MSILNNTALNQIVNSVTVVHGPPALSTVTGLNNNVIIPPVPSITGSFGYLLDLHIGGNDPTSPTQLQLTWTSIDSNGSVTGIRSSFQSTDVYGDMANNQTLANLINDIYALIQSNS